MNATPIVDAHQPHEIREGPGTRLRQARLSRGLEMSRVAAQLHLSDAMVEALERDDYDKLPGPVFVRGYLKNYTRLLGLDPERVLEDYEQLTPIDGGGSPLARHSRIKPDVESSHVLVRMVTWLMVILLIALLVTWWQGRLSWPWMEKGPPDETRVEPVSPVDKARALPELPARRQVAPPIGDTERDASDTGIEPTDAESLPDTVALEASEPAVEATLGEPRKTPPAEPEPPAVAGSSGGEPVGDGEPAMVSSVAPSSGEASSPATRSATIQFVFNDSSWLDVRDASGKHKLVGVMAKDTRRTLSGEPPFSVVLGNARVVEVRVNDQPYDVSKYIRGDVARFEVDPGSP